MVLTVEAFLFFYPCAPGNTAMHVPLYHFKALRALMSKHAGSEVSIQALVASEEKST